MVEGDCGVASRVAHVLLVATHPDTSRTPRTSQGHYISSQTERLLSQLTDKFGTLFEIYNRILIVDAHVANSPGIKAVKSYLTDAKYRVLQVSNDLLHIMYQNKTYQQFRVMKGASLNKLCVVIIL